MKHGKVKLSKLKHVNIFQQQKRVRRHACIKTSSVAINHYYKHLPLITTHNFLFVSENVDNCGWPLTEMF